VTAVFFLNAYSILDMNGGNRVFSGDARLLSMGSAGVFNPGMPGAISENPGLIGYASEGITLQLGTLITHNSETRSIPMYNFFDGYINDANYVSNSDFYEDLTGSISYRHQLDKVAVGINLGWKPLLDFNSDYEEQVRNDGNTDSGNSGDNSPDGYPPIIAKNILYSQGQLGGVTAGLGFNWDERVSLGFQVQQLSGNWESVSRIRWTEAARELAGDLEDREIEINGDFEESYRYSLGAAFRLNERLGLGVAMHLKNELARDIYGRWNEVASEEVYWDTFSVAGILDTLMWQDKLEQDYGKYVIPATYRVGLQYRPRNVWETRFNFDLELVQYSDINKRFDDITNFYLGVEHKINQKLPLRFGFNYKTSYHIFEAEGYEFAGKVTKPAFSAGTGFSVMSVINLDLGIEYSLRKYEQIDLFPDSYYDHDGLWNEIEPIDRDWSNPDQVNESLITLQASITWQWQVK